MPEIQIHGATISYEEHGAGPETIVFAHGFLWSGSIFENQVKAFRDRYRCIAFDFRGQGRSEVTSSGYDIDTLTEDVAALIESLQCAPCHFAGLSMGGFVGLRLAIRRPDIIRSLMLLETSAEPEIEEHVGRYRLMSFIARWLGIRVVANRVMPIMFGEKFLRDPARAQLRKVLRQRIIANNRVGITRTIDAIIKREGIADQLHMISVPTLIVVGDQDVATPPEKAEQMHARIRGSELVVIPDAGHTSIVEEPEAVNAAMEGFLSRLMNPHEAGTTG